jgi:hypothetical protein
MHAAENAILFDLDRKFDVLRLVKIMGHRLQSAAQHADPG